MVRYIERKGTGKGVACVFEQTMTLTHSTNDDLARDRDFSQGNKDQRLFNACALACFSCEGVDIMGDRIPDDLRSGKRIQSNETDHFFVPSLNVISWCSSLPF